MIIVAQACCQWLSRGLLLLMLTALVVLLAAPLPAQELGGQPDYSVWNRVASRAEENLAVARTSERTLSELRAEIVGWRSQFSVVQNADQARIETLRSQIAALGPVPAAGEAEAPEIASRRAELVEQLARLQAPGLAAVEAFSRADGIIREIDSILRLRQADALLKLSPSPINPANWPAAFVAVSGAATAISSETIGRIRAPGGLDALKNRAPVVVLYLLVAGALLWRGREWMDWVAHRLVALTSSRGRQVIFAVVSLGQILLPFSGVLLLVAALSATGFFGTRGLALLEELPFAGATLLAAWWLGGRVFPRDEAVDAPFTLLSERRAEGRFLVSMMGLLLALQGLIQSAVVPVAGMALAVGMLRANMPMVVPVDTTDAAAAVIQFPLIVLSALLLFRTGQLLRRHLRNESAASSEASFRDKIVGIVGNAAIALALIAPILATLGYVSAANALIWPAILSLGLFGLVVVVHKFVADFYVLVMRLETGARESLVPVLVGFALSLAALPVMALIWGVRPDELREIWTSFRSGIPIGGARISPTAFLTFAVVFAIGYAFTRLLQGALKSSILPKTALDKGGQNAISAGVGYVGIFLAALLAITSAGIDLSSLAIVAGALSVGIGFGLQNIVSNFVSGIILLIERPISEGDWIEVGGQQGVVRSISVRSTLIETFDRTEVIVPNADFVSGKVTNWTRSNPTGRLIVKVGVAYGTNTRRVAALLEEIANNHPMVMLQPPPRVLFTGFGADALEFEIRVILSDVNFKLAAASDMNHEIARIFAEEGIEIPFAQRDIWLRNPEVLRAAPRAEPAPGPTAEAAPEPPQEQPQ
jgi:potassium efflux system protein